MPGLAVFSGALSPQNFFFIASAVRQTLFSLLYKRRTNISCREIFDQIKEELFTIRKYHKITTIDTNSATSIEFGNMLDSAIRSIHYIKQTAIPLRTYMNNDTNYMKNDREMRIADENYLTYRYEFFNTLNPVRQISLVQGGTFIPNYDFITGPDGKLNDLQKLEIYMNARRDGKIENPIIYDLLIGRRIDTETST